MDRVESHFIEHIPCVACGSSDANSLYSDGHTHCHKCGAHSKSTDATQTQSTPRRVAGNLIQQLEIRSLAKRGLTETTCAKYGYGVGEYNGRQVQIAPYHDKDGRVVAQKVRFPSKDFVVVGDMKSGGLFGQHLFRDKGKKIVITEGEIDCLSVSQLMDNRWPVVSVPSGAAGAKKAIVKELEFLEGFEEVVLMFDMDEAGQSAAVECAMQLSPGKAKIASLPLKDANECLQAGRGKEVLDAFWGAKTYRPDGIVAGEDVWEHLTRKHNVRAAEFPHTELNARTHGMRGGELITITAGTGSGKSTFCREIAYHLILQGEKVGYIGLEESVQRSALGMCSLALNKPLHLNNTAVDDPALRKVFDENLRDKIVFYDHWGSLQSDHLLNKIRFMVKGCGCNFIILDHLSIVISGMDETQDERRAIDITMTRLASLAQETGACILLVSHLKKSDGKPHEEGRAVSLSDLRGSHGIAQLSHTIISIERDQQSEDEKHISIVRVLKCRWTGDTGKAGLLRYDRETGRLQQCDESFLPAAAADDDGEF